jgi:hypothetical protein
VDVGLAHTRFVSFLCTFSYSDVYVTLQFCACDVLHTEDKLHQLGDDFAWPRHQILVPHYVNRYLLLLEPVGVEVTPNGDLVFDPSFPLHTIVQEIRVQNRAVVRASAIHMKQTDDTI